MSERETNWNWMITSCIARRRLTFILVRRRSGVVGKYVMFYIGLAVCLSSQLITERNFIDESKQNSIGQSFELKRLNCIVGKWISQITVVRSRGKTRCTHRVSVVWRKEHLTRLRLHTDHWMRTWVCCWWRSNRLSRSVDIRRGRGEKDLLEIFVEIVCSILIFLNHFADSSLAHCVRSLRTRRERALPNAIERGRCDNLWLSSNRLRRLRVWTACRRKKAKISRGTIIPSINGKLAYVDCILNKRD